MKIHHFTNGPAPAGTAQPQTKYWNVVTSEDMDSAEITLYGDVCDRRPVDWWTGQALEGNFITPEGFLEDLERVKNKSSITIKLNSVGGDVYTGIAIHNALRGLTAKKTVVVEGIAASAASVIACAGDTVQVYPGSIIMIHGVSVTNWDPMTMGDIKKLAKAVDSMEAAIAEIYHAKTGLDTDKLRNMMAKEEWMTGQKAIDNHFADELIGGNGPEMSLSADRRLLFVAGVTHDVHSFHHIPGTIPTRAGTTNGTNGGDAPGANNQTPTGQAGKGGSIEMDEKELRAQYPELVASIEAKAADAARTEAVAAERARLKAIDEIAPGIGDEKMLAEARYGEHACSAEALALEAMKKQAAQGKNFMTSLAADAAASGASDVAGNPNAGAQDDTDNDKKAFAEAVDAYNKTKGGQQK